MRPLEILDVRGAMCIIFVIVSSVLRDTRSSGHRHAAMQEFLRTPIASAVLWIAVLLVMLAAKRVKSLYKGARPLIDNKAGNKNVVCALREIAAGKDIGLTRAPIRRLRQSKHRNLRPAPVQYPLAIG